MGSNLGIKIEKSNKLRDLKEYFFGEDQGRYVLEIDEKNLASVEKFLKSGSIYKIEQHKLVYKSLKGKMGNELHALSINTFAE